MSSAGEPPGAGGLEPGCDSFHSVVRRLKKYEANGAAIARISADQMRAASTGCCIGQAWMAPEGLGLPHRSRAPAVTALTGFQSAMACSHPGMCCVGTMALDTKASGKSTMKPND